MARSLHAVLTRRERQIMDILFRRGRATAAEVMEELPADTTYSTVRTQLRVLEEKGHIRHEQDGQRYVYVPSTPRADAGASHLTHVVRTFFDGSTEQAVTALLRISDAGLSDAEVQRLRERIRSARSTGR
jgi:predicted transcriptional regulator